MGYDAVNTVRSCEAILIPSGVAVTIPADSQVYITQSLGGNYTVNVNGNLARIAAKDADVLGFDKEEALAGVDSVDNDCLADGEIDEEMIWDQLRDCYDPEIPINIVELGLIYECKILSCEQGKSVHILMTLTAPGCGMGDFLVEDIKQKIAMVPNIVSVEVELTFDPPWDQSRMSEMARLATGMY